MANPSSPEPTRRRPGNNRGHPSYRTGYILKTKAIPRISVRDLTPETHANAIGIDLADVTTSRLVRGVDYHATYINALTSLTPQTAEFPSISRAIGRRSNRF